MFQKVLAATIPGYLDLDIRHKLALIVVSSILVTAIPSSIFVYRYAAENILENEVDKLNFSLKNESADVDHYFEASETRLKNLAIFIEKELEKPQYYEDVLEFSKCFELNADGVWRNKKADFNGLNEAGAFIPEAAVKSDGDKITFVRIKRIFDYTSASKSQGNVWYLSPTRSEIIFDTTFPRFVFDQKSDNDYTQTPWVLNTSPQHNPDRKFGLTPPLLDPVPNAWMVSSIYPLYLGKQWLGSLGQDFYLKDVLGFMQHRSDAYQGTQHFLMDANGNFILAGNWQKELESSTNAERFSLKNHPDLAEIIQRLDHRTQDEKSIKFQLNGKSYIGISNVYNNVGWRHYMLVPESEILASTRNLFYAVVIILFFGSIFGGVFIAFAVNNTVVKRIRELVQAIKFYESGEREKVSLSLPGKDDISVAAREFETMMLRVDLYVDELKQAQDDLQKSEARWRFALEGASDGVWELDLTKRISHLSPRMMEILGLDPAVDNHNLNMHEMRNAVHPDSLAQMGNAYADLLNGVSNRLMLEHKIIKKDGSHGWLLTRGMLVNDEAGKPKAVIGTSSDISIRKQTEAELKAAHAKYERIIENVASDYSFYTLDKHGNFTYVSLGSSDLIGWQPEEYMHQHYTKTLTKHPINEIAIQFTEAGLKGEKQATYLIEELCKDGSTVWLELNETPIFDEAGNVIGLDGISHNVTQRIRAEASLKEAHAKYEHLVENISNEYYFYKHDTSGIFTFVSNSVEQMLGWTPDEFEVHHTKFLTDNPINQQCFQYTEAGLRGEKQPSYLVERFHKDGSKRWLELNEKPVFDESGKVVGLEGIAHDVTARLEAETKLQLAAGVFMHAREGIMITDATGKIVEVNDTFCEISGYTRDEVIGRSANMLRSYRQTSSTFDEMWDALEEKGHWYGELWNLHKNGNDYAITMTISAVLDVDGRVKNYVALFTDITMMKHHQQQLEHIAHYDVLTNLPNRVLLADRLEQAMLQCQRTGHIIAVAFLDLDGFKEVNDKYGHEIGDELLVNLAQRMRSCLRDSDTLARIGGDEFVAVLEDLENVRDCEPLLMRMLRSASSIVQIQGHDLQVSASIGVTLYPQDGGDADQLLRHADQAMYLAKQAGKNRYHLFDIEQDIAVKARRESIEHITAALENKEFVLYYQPKVNMRTGAVIGAEALIRWQHPENGILPPAVFLPVIENHPLSIKVGEWVIAEALKQIESWQQAGFYIPVSVNIGAMQLQSEDFVIKLEAILSQHKNVNPECLELEILETSALEDIMQVSELMHACRTLGVHFALDDFGTGYSSLTYLKRLPADYLKIDQSFVRDMIEDPDDLAIVQGVVGLAKAFHREVIAEGVETIAHGTLLLGLGCELAQGYGIARPMPADKLTNWVLDWKPNSEWMPNSDWNI